MADGALGFIGAGGIAAFHAEGADRAGARLAAFCDVDEARAKALAASYPGAAATTSIDELLAMPAVTAVVVAVPNALHRDCAIRAMESGKDVLLEKPMAMSRVQCDEIIAVMERTGRLLQMGFVSRCSPAALAAQRLVEAGRLGRVYHARAQWCRRRGIPGLGGWFTTRAMAGGGVLIDLGVHMIDIVLHLTGRPPARRVSGSCTSTFGAPIEDYLCTDMWAGPPRPGGAFDVEDAASAFIRLDGMTMEVAVTWAANLDEEAMPNRVTLLGDRGGCTFDMWGNSILLTTEEDGMLVDVRPQLPPAEPWAAAWQRQHAVFQEVLASRTPTATAQEGRAVQAILDAIYRSSDEGREVEVG